MANDEHGGEDTKERNTRVVSALRVELQQAQFRLREANVAVIVLIGGVDTSSVNETMLILNEWLDPRWARIYAFARPTKDERRRPPFWRYWRILPARGNTVGLVGGWTVRAIADRLLRRMGSKRFDRRLDQIEKLERMLVDDGAIVLKFWHHVDKKVLARRLRAAKKRPKEAWRVDESEWFVWKHYGRTMKLVEQALERTGTAAAPWRIVETPDARERGMEIARAFIETVEERVDARQEGAAKKTAGKRTGKNARTTSGTPDPLGDVDLSVSLSKADYDERLERHQAELRRLSREAAERGIASMLVFEGWDAAGKGGVIRRLSAALYPAHYRVYPIGAPTQDELAHHYLWRFWGRLPPDGRIAIFDRSWYGRVLVERVEGLAAEADWRRAYDEINAFEEMVSDHGVLVHKFWMHIDKQEQLRRFRDREKTPYKRYKITDEDWRNRKKWAAYAVAVNDMIDRTSTKHAPWEIVPANDKKWARVRVVESFCRRLDEAL